MNKNKFKLAMLLLGSMLLARGAATALAFGPPYPAVVTADPPIPCTLLAADGTPFIALGSVPHIVASSPKSGNVKFVCHADQPALFDKPTKTVHFDFENTGGVCSVGPGETTEDWESIVTPSGKVIMVCHINPSSGANN